jgi:hypothetical protein
MVTLARTVPVRRGCAVAWGSFRASARDAETLARDVGFDRVASTAADEPARIVAGSVRSTGGAAVGREATGLGETLAPLDPLAQLPTEAASGVDPRHRSRLKYGFGPMQEAQHAAEALPS